VEVAKVTSKGQITIPISIRRKLEINEGDKVLFIYKSDGVMMVNPNNMQSGIDEEVIEAAETKKTENKGTAKRAPKTAAPDAEVSLETEPGAEAEEAPAAAAKTTQSDAPRSAPPPVEEPEKPDKHVGGFNLSTLLDDIRSIGSNI
jgi:AbrB family looped-hinge helix DNA binding protein